MAANAAGSAAPAAAAAAGGAGGEEVVDKEQIARVFSEMIESRRSLISKIGELEGEWTEHK
jgi:hypothetical protein